MFKILILGGTTEGRQLAVYCLEHGYPSVVSVVSDYGKEQLPVQEGVQVLVHVLGEEELEALLRREAIDVVFDATHPYAVAVTAMAERVSQKCGISYYRVLRKGADQEEIKGVQWMESAAAAARFLEKTSGFILLTTGSRELGAFQSLKERLFVRVLPAVESLDACYRAGIKGNRIIAMQGPFSTGLNEALIRETKAAYLVSKESGKNGGFYEKLEAAKRCGIKVVLIGRPTKEAGVTLNTACRLLDEMAEKSEVPAGQDCMVTIAGVGMGGPGQMTLEAAEAFGGCQVVLGAERMIESVRQVCPKTECHELYLSGDILKWIRLHPKYSRIGVACSGDTGFYSNAKKLVQSLKGELSERSFHIRVIPGISSVSYLCARLGKSWEDMRLLSGHGRECNLLEEVEKNKQVFALLGGKGSVSDLCRQLLEQGYSDAVLSVGERLSYPEERIVTGLPRELLDQEFDALAAVVIERGQKRGKVNER